MSRAAYMREYRARKAVERDKDGLLPFQSAFVAAVCRQDRPPVIARRAGQEARENRGYAAVWWRGH